MTKFSWRLACVSAALSIAALGISLQPFGTIVAEDQSAKASAEMSEAGEDSAGEKAADDGDQPAEKGKGSASKNKKSRKETAPKKKTSKGARQPAGTRAGSGARSGSGGAGMPSGGSGGRAGTGPTGSSSSGSSSGAASGSGDSGSSSDGSGDTGGGRGNLGGAGNPPASPNDKDYPPDVVNAINAQEKHSEALLKQEGVVGTAVSLDENNKVVIQVYTSGAGKPQIPQTMGGVPVKISLSGPIRPLNGSAGSAKYDPRLRQKRPVPIGTSAFQNDNPSCSGSVCATGTLGCRLKAKDGSGYYALSNSHVFADEGNAALDTNIVQPGPYDNTCICVPEDIVGKLVAFKPFNYLSFNNVMDAAIISTTAELVSNHTLADGYGVPRVYTIKKPQLGMRVQKYGRTTGYTKGRVTGINAIVLVGYTGGGVFFRRQLHVTGDSGTIFADHGDSGSLIVDQDRFPISLLFAGSDITHVTDGNPIQEVLDEFGMEIDGDDSLDFQIPGKSGRTQPDSK